MIHLLMEHGIACHQRVHETGLALSEAAMGQDMPEVLTLNAQLQRECVACHTSFRDRLADRADK